MTSTKHKVNVKRKQMGFLTISNKNYPIYEGLNVIGRDVKATVLLKDVKFSKQHAVISVVDENTHFLSDFASSNGTRLGSKCLVPYQLYRINDQERITFSDVPCLYHKITESNKVVQIGNLSIINEELSKTQSQFDGQDAVTQILPFEKKKLSNKTSVSNINDSQDMHLAPTQKILNIHDAPTQQILNIYDEPTQNQTQTPASLTDDFIRPTQVVCDTPTQILEDKSSDAVTNPLKQKQCKFVTSTQDAFSHTECYDDVFANETFRLSVNKQSNIGVEVDETVLVDKCNVTIESDSEKEVMLNTGAVNKLDNCVGVVIEAKVCVEDSRKSVGDDSERKETDNRHTDKNSDDSETTDIEKDDKKHTKLDKNTNNDGSGSETDMERNIKNDKQVKNSAKNNGDMDSETNMDVEIIKNVKRKKFRKQRGTATKQISSDDSDTDIEASSKVKSSKKNVKTVESDSETDIEASSKAKSCKKNVKTVESDSETDMEGNKPVETRKTAPSATSVTNNTVNNVDSGSETEIEDENELLLKIKHTASIGSRNGTEKVTPVAEQAVTEAWSGSDEELDLLAPTQKFSDSFPDKNATLPDKSTSNGIHEVKTNNTSKLNVDDAFEDDDYDLLVPTQLLQTDCTEEKSAEEKIAEAPTHLLANPANNEQPLLDSLAPTQLLEPVTVMHGIKTDCTEEKSAEEKIAEAPTQLLANPENNEQTILDSLAPTQLLEPVTAIHGRKTDCTEEKSADEKIAETPTQLLENPANNEQTILDSLATTQLLEPVTAMHGRKTDEEINSEAPTQLLEPIRRSSGANKEQNVEAQHLQPTQLLLQSSASTSKVNVEDEDLADTQLLKPTVFSKASNEENVELDSLPPTQLLQPVQMSSDVQNNEIADAETQMVEDMRTTADADKENDDLDSLAPTQLLKPQDLSSKQNEEDVDYLAPTQLLQLDGKAVDNEANDNEEISENVFLAPTQSLELQSTPIAKRNGVKQVELEENDEDSLVPTQKLSLSCIKKSSQKNVSFSEDIFSAATQILPRNEEHAIFLAPTQRLTPRKSLGMKRRPEDNEDDDDEDDFMAPTQLLTTNKKDKKSSKETVDLDFSINDDPHYINIDYSSDDTSMKLAVSSNDANDFCAPTQKLELSKNNNDSVEKTTNVALTKLQPEPETQFEVDFNLDTQKLYVETATCRPNNPVGNMFGEENTQLTETENQTQAVNLVSTELKTITDIDQTMSSNIETSDSSFQEGSKKRSFEEDADETSNKRSKKLVKNQADDVTHSTRRTSKRAETINSKYAKTNIANKTGDVTNSPKKRGRKVEENHAVDKTSSFEEDATSVPSSTSNIVLMEKILSDGTEKDTDDKSLETKLPETPRRMSKRGARVTEERELEPARKTPARRVKKLVVEEEKRESELLKDLLQTNKSPEVKVILTKIVEDALKEENITVEHAKIKYKKPSEQEIVPKRQPGRPKKSETNVKNVVSTRSTRNKSNSNEESSDCKSSKENISELGDFALKTRKPPVTRRTRGKQVKKKIDDDDEEETVLIEDSDDSTNSNIEKYIRKNVLKLDYTDESCSGSSATSVVVPNPRHNKRSLKIEDYSSDENSNKNENTCNSYTDTPNTKRRRYEPLNITAISNGQTSNAGNEPIKHKIVFTMLNNPELETTVKSLGGTTIDSVYECTALVTNKISRSLKFLIAVSLGKPIVNTTWISESAKKRMFLDPWNYLLEDTESESKYKFSLSESLQRARSKKLLTGYTILLVVHKNFDVLKEIIETCGGKCVTRAPARSAGANVVVVAYEDDKAKYSRYLKLKTPLTVVAAEAIFAGVLSQELNFDIHALS